VFELTMGVRSKRRKTNGRKISGECIIKIQ